MVQSQSPEDYDSALANAGGYPEISAESPEKYNFQRWIVDDKEEILELQYALRGIVWDDKNKTYVHRPQFRVMNDTGARKLTDVALRLISKGGKLSRFTREEIKMLMRDSMHTLLEHLYYYFESYEMKYDDIDLVLDLFEKNLLSMFNRGEGGAENDRIGGSARISSEDRIMEPQQNTNYDGYISPPKKKFGVI